MEEVKVCCVGIRYEVNLCKPGKIRGHKTLPLNRHWLSIRNLVAAGKTHLRWYTVILNDKELYLKSSNPWKFQKLENSKY